MRLGNWGRTALCVFLFSKMAMGLTLAEIDSAAAKRNLPRRFFREIEVFEGLDTVSVKSSDAARYYPLWNQIDLPAEQYNRKPTKWKAIDWTLFYNELLHAWWDLVLEEQNMYAQTRARLSNLRARYAEAYPRDPALAQEEAFSETTSFLIVFLANGTAPEKLPYRIGRTVAAVSHDDRPGYSEAAESTYLSKTEYAMLFFWLTGQNPPEAN